MSLLETPALGSKALIMLSCSLTSEMDWRFLCAKRAAFWPKIITSEDSPADEPVSRDIELYEDSI